MSAKEWLHFHNAQTLLNGEEFIREQLRAGTYAGHEPIVDEWELDQRVEQARREVEAGRLFHFDNAHNNYDLEHYSVEPEDYGFSWSDDDDPPQRGFFARLFGR
ncbi:MAG: hypothetical protein ACRDHW_02310 [Ktedonobacteraceae bacterium]